MKDIFRLIRMNDGSLRPVPASIVEEMIGLATPLPNDFCAAIGRYVIAFARLEDVLAMHVGSLIHPDQLMAQIITTSTSFRNRIEMMRALVAYRITKEHERKPYKEALGRALKAEEDRNRLIHSTWGVCKGKVFRIKTTIKNRQGLQHQQEELTSAQIHHKAVELEQLTQRITELFVPPIFVHNVDWPEPPRPPAPPAWHQPGIG